MTESKPKIIKCKQAGCTVSSDGKCLEGLTLESCPHCSIIENLNDDHIELLEDEPIKPLESNLFHNVHRGEALELNEAIDVTCSSLTRLILMAGLSDAGKTTMIASLFELFQKRNSYSGYIFAGSKTLIGFERRCHDARTASEREIQTTERTKYLPPVFLNLKVKSEKEFTTDLLFTDISGEKFEELSNSKIECQKFELAKRADHFVLFIDSEKLSDLNTRQIVKKRSLSILRSLIETQMLIPDVFIEIIFSRWDLLEEKTNKEMHKEFVETIKSDIINKFSKSHKNIVFFNLASRPRNELVFSFGYGISELFPLWVEKSPFLIEKLNDNLSDYSTYSSREFSRYMNF